jgi:hypothetical protein
MPVFKDKGKRRYSVKKAFKKIGPLFTFLFLFLGVASSVVSASDFGAERQRHRGRTQSVAEPAAIALLGAGLVSLGVYAKKKRSKKQ